MAAGEESAAGLPVTSQPALQGLPGHVRLRRGIRRTGPQPGRRAPGRRRRDASVLGEIVAESKLYFNEVYDKLGVLLTDEDAVGESFYNSFLAEVANELEKSGVAVISDGALCVFFDDIVGQNGEPLPLIIRKRDGGFGYAATDLAAIRYRVSALAAHRILYIVDARQALHFRMVFETAKRIGWLNDEVDAVHLAFGTVLGKDGKPFKTRSGETVRLISLLDEAVDRSRLVVKEKSRDLAAGGLESSAAVVGIGAVNTRTWPPAGRRTTSSTWTAWSR